MPVASPAPVSLRRRPCSAPLGPSSPFRCRSLTPAFSGVRRQEYFHNSGLGVKDNSALKLGVYANLNMQSYAQEWVEESKKLLYIRTTNNVINSIYNGTTHLRARNLCHVPSEKYKSSNHPLCYDLRERVALNSLASRCANMETAKHRVMKHTASAVSVLTSVVNDDIKPSNWHDGSKTTSGIDGKASCGYDVDENKYTASKVANIDVKKETPVGHGEVICFSIYSGNSGAQADFGNGKTCIWVDVLDGGRDVLMEFAPFFKDPSIKKAGKTPELYIKKENRVQEYSS